MLVVMAESGLTDSSPEDPSRCVTIERLVSKPSRSDLCILLETFSLQMPHESVSRAAK